jgi:hypothetical protein
MKSRIIVGILVCTALFLAATHRRLGMPAKIPPSPAPVAPARTAAQPIPHSLSTNTSTPAALPTITQSNLRPLLEQWHAVETGDDETRDVVASKMTALITDENAAEIVRDLAPVDHGAPFALAALERWLNVDAAGALAWLGGQPNPLEAQTLIAARALLSQSTASAEVWDRVPESAWTQTLLASAAREIADTDPARAIAVASRMVESAPRIDALQTIAYAWIGRDPRAATAWIVQVPDSQIREPLLAVAARAIAITDPELAADWLAATAKSEPVAPATARSIAELWAERAPAEAAAWVARFSSAETRDAVIDAVGHQWRQTQPAAANAWIASLPDGARVRARLDAELIASADPE